MVINGASRRNVRFWSNHLRDSQENDRAQLVKSYGLRSRNLPAMMREMEAQAKGTRCENFMWIADLSPCEHERLTEAQWDRAREIVELQRGLVGQPYIMVEHEKHGRAHRHVVWSRIDIENMRAIPDGLDAKICHTASRAIEMELGLQKVVGPLDRQPGTPRPKRAPKSWEMLRGNRSGLDPRQVTAEVTALFRQSENAAGFVAGLRQYGYELVKGNRDFCILDPAGDVHSLARRIENVKTKELKAFMAGMDLSGVPTVEEAKAQRQKRPAAVLETSTPALMSMPAMQPTEQPPPDGGVEDDHQAGMTGSGRPDDRQQGKEKRLADMAAEPERVTPLIVAPVMRPAIDSAQAEDDQPSTVAPIHADADRTGTRRSFTSCIKQLFRQVKKALTCSPKTRRRKTEETRGAFKLARKILPCMARMPIMPVYQAELWQWNNPDTGYQATEEFSYTQQNPLSPHL